MSTSINATQGPQAAHHEAVVAAQAQSASKADEASQASASPQYSSPVIQVDRNTGLALLLVRNTSTGAVESQYPAKQVVAEYGRTARNATPQPEADPAAASAAGAVGAAAAPVGGGSGAPAPVADTGSEVPEVASVDTEQAA